MVTANEPGDSVRACANPFSCTLRMYTSATSPNGTQILEESYRSSGLLRGSCTVFVLAMLVLVVVFPSMSRHQTARLTALPNPRPYQLINRVRPAIHSWLHDAKSFIEASTCEPNHDRSTRSHRIESREDTTDELNPIANQHRYQVRTTSSSLQATDCQP